MAKSIERELNFEEEELEALARLAKAKLYRHTASISGFFKSRMLINGGHDFAGLREYSPGDEVRAINWRASARSRQFQVHQYQQEKGARWFVCLDTSTSMYYPDLQKSSLSRQLAAAFIYILISAGNQVGLITYNKKVETFCPLGHGRQQYTHVLKHLVQLKTNTDISDSLLHLCLPYIKNRASIVIISDFLYPNFMRSGLEKFIQSGHHLHAIQVLSKNETQIPNRENITLIDCETGEQLSLESTEQHCRNAELALSRHCKALEIFCYSKGIPYSLALSENHWKDNLLSHLNKL